MNSLLKVRSLLFAFTLISAAVPASAITCIGNAEAPHVALYHVWSIDRDKKPVGSGELIPHIQRTKFLTTN